MDDNLIYKYLSGQAKPEEVKAILGWLKISSENRKMFFDIEAIWKSRDVLSDENLNVSTYHSLNSLNERINESEPDNSRAKLSIHKKIYFLFSSVAAVLVLVVFLFKYSTSPNNTMVYSYANLLPDSIRKVTLEDKSVVWLSTNATIAYSAEYGKKERLVKLKGLAFFEVEKDASHPFIVETDRFKVKVLGTSFAVNSNNFNHKGEAVLLKGSVQFEDNTGKSLFKMHPGQQLIYSAESKSLAINEVDAKAYTLWRFHLKALKNASIQNIINSIEETYNVKLQIDDVDIKDHKYNFYYKESNCLQDALDRIYYLTGKRVNVLH